MATAGQVRARCNEVQPDLAVIGSGKRLKAVCRTVPERVCQGGNGIAPGWRVTIAPGVNRSSSSLVAGNPALLSLSLLGGPSRLSSLRFGKSRSFFSAAIAPNTFLREVPLAAIASGSAGSWARQMRTCLVRIPHRMGHSIQSDVLSGWGRCWPKPTHPRSGPSRPKREGSRAALRQPRSNNRSGSSFFRPPLSCFPVTFRRLQ